MILDEQVFDEMLFEDYPEIQIHFNFLENERLNKFDSVQCHSELDINGRYLQLYD